MRNPVIIRIYRALLNKRKFEHVAPLQLRIWVATQNFSTCEWKELHLIDYKAGIVELRRIGQMKI